MKAMVLAAGLGERMRPLTEARAKPSLPLLNRPIIVQTLSYLKAQGVSEAVINLHHQPESIRGLIGDGRRLGLKVHYSEEPTILGTAGGLKKAEAHFKDAGTFIMINSDFAIDCPLAEPLSQHRQAGALATMILRPRSPGSAYGAVDMVPDGRIRSIAGLPVAQGSSSVDPQTPGAESFIFTGIHILESSVLASIPAGIPYEINSEVYPLLMQRGGLIRGFVHTGMWYEMGTPRLYLEGNLSVLADGRDPVLTTLQTAEGIYLDRISLPATTSAAPPVLIGLGSVLGQNCSLQGGVVIGKQCRIGSGCALRSSVLWDGARLGDRVQLTECIITSGVYIPPMTSLSGKILFRVDGYQGKKDHLERVGSAWAARLQ